MIQLLNWRYVRHHGEITTIAYLMESELSLEITSLIHSMEWRADMRPVIEQLESLMEKWASGE